MPAGFVHESIELGPFSASQKKSSYITIASHLVLVAVAGLLWIAAGLKSYQFLSTPPLGNSVFDSAAWKIRHIELELFFGLWLISGFLREVARWATVGLFVVFGQVAAWRAAAGESNCGCFGALEVSPWWALVLDALVIGALVLVPRISDVHTTREARWRAALVGLTCLLVGLVLAVGYIRWQRGESVVLGDVLEDGQTIVLRPERWQDRRLPLLPFIEDFEGDLRRGRWLVVLFNPSCGRCWYELPHVKQLAEQHDARVALVSVRGPVDPTTLSDEKVSCGYLPTSIRWLADTPTAIWLEAGTVRRLQSNSSLATENAGMGG